jgi:hypothetical protein
VRLLVVTNRDHEARAWHLPSTTHRGPGRRRR